jgi:hypothetical protein
VQQDATISIDGSKDAIYNKVKTVKFELIKEHALEECVWIWGWSQEYGS